ncbi:hypothetical protein Y032_0456g1785 [Ancylostoma ceylanicum]|uniref:Uncharacterized protein n=1 Tax=Ancylostoma ceylanicum TaxID=53326 RepID=A0A016WXS2_9BILA|nr:hypothetical protein Y032_0456g1785 [Ancylostoma ceylanicum]
MSYGNDAVRVETGAHGVPNAPIGVAWLRPFFAQDDTHLTVADLGYPSSFPRSTRIFAELPEDKQPLHGLYTSVPQDEKRH